MKTTFLFIPLFLAAIISLSAQSTRPVNYVAGPHYRVTNLSDSFTVVWKGEALPPDRLRTISESEAAVLDEQGAERLRIIRNEHGGFAKVVDFDYTDRQAYLLRRQAPAQPTEVDGATSPYDWQETRRFSFSNGLKVVTTGAEATATYRGQELPVTGSRGHWRVETDDFEAGVAYGPQWPKGPYQYLRER